MPSFLLFLLGAGTYLTVLNGKFIWDDYCYIVDNATIRSLAAIPELFRQGVGAGAGVPSFFYRPLQMLLYAAGYSAWGLNVIGFHAINIVLHILVAWCVYRMVILIFKDSGLAFLTAALFIVHPAHVEAVANITGTADPLAAFFMLACIVLYLKQLDAKNKPLFFITLLAFACALLSKEGALIVPLFLLLYHAVFKRGLHRPLFFSLVALGAVYIAARVTILRPLLENSLFPYTPGMGGALQRVPGFFVAVSRYIRILIAPLDLHVDYGAPLFRFWDLRAVIGYAACAGLLTAAFLTRRKDRIVSFGIAWFFIALMPVTNIYKINDSFMKGHWLYLPSIGFFLILAHAFTSLCKKKAAGLRFCGILCIAGTLFFWAFQTMRQNCYWSDPVIFMKQSLAYSPRNPVFYSELGREYMRRRDFDRALAAYQEASRLRPKDKTLYYELGAIYDDLGNKDAAAGAYQKALACDDRYLQAYNNLASVYADGGQLDRAIALWEKAVQIDPGFAVAHFNLAVFYFQEKKYDLAIKHSDAVIALGYTVDPVFVKRLAPFRRE